MSEQPSQTPFKTLGTQLKRVRQRLRESVAEVSGAIEVDESMLNRIERGQERPSEDILLLLITHFSMRDDEAVKLWELAGYDRSHPNAKNEEDSLMSSHSLVMIMALDNRIVYSDSVQVVANPNGVVMNFLQAPDGPYTSQTIARIGMSREQATKVLHVLNQALLQSSKSLQQPKNLPAPDSGNQQKPHIS